MEPRGTCASIEGRTNSEGFSGFLRKLRSDAGCPIIVVVDNASYHKSKKVLEWGRENDVTIEILPPYCPELNPDEQV